MAHQAPGKHYREGLSLVELTQMFPTTQKPNGGSLRRAGPMAQPVLGANLRTLRRCGLESRSLTVAEAVESISP